MKEYGLSEHGFKAKSFHDIKNDLENTLKSEVDPSLRFTPDTIAGVLTSIVANQTRQVWESLQGLYSSLDPNLSFGKSLEALCSLTGTSRNKAKPSKVKALVRLAAQITLPKNSLAQVEGDINAIFKTIYDVKNNSNQEEILEVDLEADKNGPIYAPATKLNKIITPQAGWLGITNPENAALGCLDETDEELRLRRFRELRATGSATIDAIKAQILSLKNVQAVHIEERAHEFIAYVMGGDDKEIAQTLWLNKPLGVKSEGDILQEVISRNGQTQQVKFSRPALTKVSLALKLRVKPLLEENEIAYIKSQILNFTKNLKLGQEFYPSKLYPILFNEPKLLDVISINLDPILKEVRPYELIELKDIDITQVLETAS